METIAIETLLSLVAGLLPEFGVASTSVVTKIITALETLVPILAQNFTNLLTPVQNIISELQSSGNLTAAQITALESLDAQCDAAFENAATAAGLPNPAPVTPATPAATS